MTLTAAAAASSQKNGCTSGFLTPVERAKELLGSSWLEDMEAHLLRGYVCSTPTAFAMFRPVPHGAEVFGPWRQWPEAECDAFFIWAAVGPLAQLLAFMPRPLPWVGWMRLGRGWPEIHWMETARLRSYSSQG